MNKSALKKRGRPRKDQSTTGYKGTSRPPKIKAVKEQRPDGSVAKSVSPSESSSEEDSSSEDESEYEDETKLPVVDISTVSTSSPKIFHLSLFNFLSSFRCTSISTCNAFSGTNDCYFIGSRSCATNRSCSCGWLGCDWHNLERSVSECIARSSFGGSIQVRSIRNGFQKSDQDSHDQD